ncbi:5840_t:CDS:10 [Funneliformis mosseae]|uniref:5840_t:CDS:1 n=1 Tax=Funneliformis mosseae TaxID=27381 RepID=A0A9N8W853_FUNMO|nr:5840_t:CDS:10 [Funneliformis mosseae]
MEDATYAPPTNRASLIRRGKSLSRPERYQPAAPLLTGKKERKTFDPWILFARAITFWAPSVLLSKFGLPDKQSRQAWREKFALCFIAAIMGGIVAFLTVGFRPVLCPESQANNAANFLRFGEVDGVLGILGYQFNISQAFANEVNFFEELKINGPGYDITNKFKRNLNEIPQCLLPEIQNYAVVTTPLCTNGPNCPLPRLTEAAINQYHLVNTTKLVGFDWEQVGKMKNFLVVAGAVLNMNSYMEAHPNPIENDLADKIIRDVLNTDHPEGGKDATRLFFNQDNLKQMMGCLREKYFVGNIDKQTIGCFTSDIFNLIMLIVILGIVMCRFFMACIFDWFISHRLAHEPKEVKKAVIPQQVVVGSNRNAPWIHRNNSGSVKKTNKMDRIGNDLYTVLLVTCYSEGEAGLRTTCESMASTDYPDDRKLLFVICDGIITGSGNDKSTPDICVEMMVIDDEFKDPQAQSYIAVASGAKQHNMAKVFAGYFPWKERKVPMILVVKCGAPAEQGKPKPGNRGKRDSQLILMNFFSRLTYNDRMCALDFDLFRKVQHLMGVTPDFFEIVLMVDADTKVYPDSLRLLINCMCNDPLIMGLCGETKIANKRDSWVTAIQVFEYYISHHLGKGFESVFGGVTCLPGCFCMYRLKARKGDDDWVPIITKPEIVQEYSQNTVNTLHQKNLLLLGEDRFLTTLMLRNFPQRKMTFCPQAVCKTVVPDEFKVLLSQRRRWINSTIHNLMELVLVRNLCGTFCFSMQFVVFMELMGTVVLPVAIMLTFLLITTSIINPPNNFSESIPLFMLAAVLGLPVPLKRWEDWERTRLRRVKRQERKRQQMATLAVRTSHFDDNYTETSSNTSAVEEPQQKGFKGQAKKDMQAVEGYVAERAEGEGIDESKLDKALNIVNEEIVNEEKKRRNDQKLQKQKDSEKIKVSREDIEFIMKEMDVMKHEADKYLREHKGDLVEALKAMVNASLEFTNIKMTITRGFAASTLPLVRTLPNTIIKKHSGKNQNLYKSLSPIVSRNFSLQFESEKPKTFSNQHIIPRLPIPTLQETAERYKKSLLPIFKPEDYARAANVIDEFVKTGGLGEVLQARLHELDKFEKHSWLENIWLNRAYLEWREPTLINVNWWCEFKDHPNGILKQTIPKGQVTDFQINRTAGFISNLLDFNDTINNESLPPESSRQGPLCMNQYRKQFGTARIADFPSDRIISSWPTTAKHIIVLFRDQIFNVQVLGEGGARVSIKDIERQLKSVVEQVNNTIELQLPIGLLTAEHRDTWAAARKTLESLSENRLNLGAIDTALFCVALDDYSTDSDIDITHHNIFHAFNGRNRWFDKPLQVIVQSNGRAGVNGEHSPADAVIPGRLFDYIVSKEPAQDPNNSCSIPLPTPKHLKWVNCSSLGTTINQAQSNIHTAIDNVDSVLLHYNEYGSNWLKSVSPDAFVQMALQLAYYRQNGEPCPTYESASTRGFLHGRTETVRSCSVDSVAFTKAFDDKDIKKERKLALFTNAIKSHMEYMISATNGKGVDRHLLGLRCQIQNEEEKSRAHIFTDPTYARSMYFKLSSSNMSPGDYFYAGFGAVVPEGYGIAYGIGKEGMKFSICSYKTCKQTDSVSFRKTLKNVFDDLRVAL